MESATLILKWPSCNIFLLLNYVRVFNKGTFLSELLKLVNNLLSKRGVCIKVVCLLVLILYDTVINLADMLRPSLGRTS